MAKRQYELLLVIEASTDAAALGAANAAWHAVDSAAKASVRDSLVRERLPDGTVQDPGWPGWDDTASVELAVRYVEP